MPPKIIVVFYLFFFNLIEEDLTLRKIRNEELGIRNKARDETNEYFVSMLYINKSYSP